MWWLFILPLKQGAQFCPNVIQIQVRRGDKSGEEWR
jgi:hypothetical protein